MGHGSIRIYQDPFTGSREHKILHHILLYPLQNYGPECITIRDRIEYTTEVITTLCIPNEILQLLAQYRPNHSAELDKNIKISKLPIYLQYR